MLYLYPSTSRPAAPSIAFIPTLSSTTQLYLHRTALSAIMSYNDDSSYGKLILQENVIGRAYTYHGYLLGRQGDNYSSGNTSGSYGVNTSSPLASQAFAYQFAGQQWPWR